MSSLSSQNNKLDTRTKAVIPSQVIQIPTPNPPPDLQFSAWIPNFDTPRAINSFSKQHQFLYSVLPVSTILLPDLTIQKTGVELSELISTKQSSDIKVLASVTNQLDRERLHSLLQDTVSQERIISEIVMNAKTNNFDGVDLDFENVVREDREAFTNFVSDLKKRAKQNKLKLSVTLHAKSTDSDGWDGAGGQDYHALGKIADEVRIMAYDIHTLGTKAGSIIPIDTLDKILNYTTQTIPVDKLVIAFPTYGYDWSSGNTYSLQYEDIVNLQEKYPESVLSLDENSYSQKLTYSIGGERHELWFENAETIAKKADLAKKYGVYKFCFWRLGGEDPGLFKVLKE